MFDLKMCKFKAMEGIYLHNFSEKKYKIMCFDIIIEGYSNRRFFCIVVFADYVEYFEYGFAHYIFGRVKSE